MGLNQVQFSEFLNQPRSTLSMSELDERCLPTSAMLKVILLREFFTTMQNELNATNIAISASRPVHEIEDLNVLLQKWIMQFEKKITETQNKLAHVKSRYQHICTINGVINKLAARLSPNDFSDYEKSWLQLYLHRLSKRKTEFGLNYQISLQLKIDTLQYQLQRCYTLKMGLVTEEISKQ